MCVDLETQDIPFLRNLVFASNRSMPNIFGYCTYAPEPFPRLFNTSAVSPVTKIPSPPEQASKGILDQFQDRANTHQSDVNLGNADSSMDSNTDGSTGEPNWTGTTLDGGRAEDVMTNNWLSSVFNNHEIDASLGSTNKSALPSLFSETEVSNTMDDSTFCSISSGGQPTPCMDTSSSLQSRLDDLTYQLMCFCMALPQDHYASFKYVRFDYMNAFFSAAELKSAIATYFHHFHPHCPCVHPATFDPQTVSIQLLLAVLFAGTFFKSCPEQLFFARHYLNLADEFVLSNPIFKGQEYDDVDDGTMSTRERTEILQAAVIFANLQNHDGNEAAQQRLRLQNFAITVNVSLGCSK